MLLSEGVHSEREPMEGDRLHALRMLAMTRLRADADRVTRTPQEMLQPAPLQHRLGDAVVRLMPVAGCGIRFGRVVPAHDAAVILDRPPERRTLLRCLTRVSGTLLALLRRDRIDPSPLER